MTGNKNKILFILHLPPPVHGSSVVGLQIKESKVINAAYDCRYINLGTSATIDEIGKNAFGKIIRYISILWQVIKNLIDHRPDLCYLAITAQGIGFYKDAVVVLLIKLFRVKLVYHFHNKGVSHRQDRFLGNLIYRFVFRNADVILLSKHLYPDIQKYISENRLHYCPNGIPSQQETKNQKRETKNASAPELLFLSHLIETKGVYVLLEALKMLREKDIVFHCTIIGSEKDITENQLKLRIEKAGMEGYILVAGKKYGEEKQKALEMVDIFVLPTYNECMPLVLLEAMQHLLPIISTFEGAIPDVVENGKTGFLVTQKDTSALAEKLRVLINDPGLRQRMGRAGREKYEKEFTLDIFEKRMKEILDQLIVKNEKA